MKRYLYLMSIPAMMTLNSCLQEDIVKGNGQEVTAKVTLNLPGDGVQSRAGDPSQPNLNDMRLFLSVYEGGELVKTYVEETDVDFGTNGKYTTNIRLVSGKTYKIVAWADHGEGYYAFDAASATVAMAEEQDGSINVAASETLNDAYFVTQTETLTDNSPINLTLKRPFGLIKVTTEDWSEAAVEADKPTQYTTTMNVPTQMNILDGTVSTETEAVTFSGAIAEEAAAEGKKVLSFDYVFAGEEQSALTDFTVNYKNEAGNEVCSYDFKNIPTRRNYITNITGNVLTKNGDVNVDVDPGWEGNIVPVASDEDFMNAIKNAKDGDVIKLTGNVGLTPPLTLNLGNGNTVGMDLNGQVLSIPELEENDITVNSGTLKIYNGNITAEKKGSVDGCLAAKNTGELILEDVTYNTEGCALFVGEQATLKVVNSTINAGAYVVTSNALNSKQNVHVSIEGSTLKASTPVLLNVPSEISVNDCDITGDTQGMVVRGGNAVISNSTITLVFEGDDYDFYLNYFKNSQWGSGNMVNIAAMTIGNKSTDAYQYPTNVELKKTHLKLAGKNGDKFPGLYAYANQGEGLGVTLTYDEECVFDTMPEYGSANIIVNGVAPIYNK